MAKKNFLEIDDSLLKNQLLFQAQEEELGSLNLPLAGEWTQPQEALVVTPLPGLCVKVKNDDEKIFVNIVHSDEIAAPDDVSDAQLAEILESEQATQYRIPMSLLDPHTEKDSSGKDSLAYDVLINTTFLKKVEGSDLFRTFFIVIVLEGIEDKYRQRLDKENYVVLKNKRYMGSKIPKHHIRNRLIAEMGAKSCFSDRKKPKPSTSDVGKNPLIAEIKSTKISEKREKPKTQEDIQYQIVKIPKEGKTTAMAGEFWLPDVRNMKDVILLVGRDRIIVETNKKKVDLFVPYELSSDECEANFDHSRQMLTVRVPLISTSA